MRITRITYCEKAIPSVLLCINASILTKWATSTRIETYRYVFQVCLTQRGLSLIK